MCGTTSSTFSPATTSTMRNTPCVLGCCGPMLMGMSMTSGASCSMTMLLVTFARAFAQVLALPLLDLLQRIVLAEREVVGHVVRQQQGHEVPVPFEVDPEHVARLPLVPVGGRIDRRDARQVRIVVGDARLHCQLVRLRERRQVIDDLDP